MPETYAYRVNAFNTATESANKIHDDTVAKNLGFRGGLVPGVDVYAYLCHLPAAAWGVDWLTRGTITARSRRRSTTATTSIVGAAAAANVIELTSPTPTGGFCASGAASLPVDLRRRARPGGLARLPGRRQPRAGVARDARRRSRSAGSTSASTPTRRTPTSTTSARRAPVFRRDGLAHPGWLLRYCNFVLTSNFVLGPWIHVESTAQFFSAVDRRRAGANARPRSPASARARATSSSTSTSCNSPTASGRSPATAHRAIYQPRGDLAGGRFLPRRSRTKRYSARSPPGSPRRRDARTKPLCWAAMVICKTARSHGGCSSVG